MCHSPQEFHKKMAIGSERDAEKKQLGKAGENKARAYLKKSGYKILRSNYKNPFGEVDIIAEKEGVIAFIEVKTRLTDIFGQPSEAVNSIRQRKYINAAKYYFSGRQMDCVVRFDIIEVFKDKINHIENAFY